MEDEKNVNEEKKLNDNVEQNVTPNVEENGEKIQETSAETEKVEENKNDEVTTEKQEDSTEEKVEDTKTTSEESKAKSSGIVEWIKSNTKLVAIIAAVIAIIAVLGVIISNVTGSPEKAIKGYLSALSSGNAKNLEKNLDIKGILAYSDSYSYWSGIDADKFLKAYDKVEKDDVKKAKENLEELIDQIREDKKDYSVKLLEVKNQEDVKGIDNMYKVEIKARIKYKDSDGDKQDKTDTFKFIIYKNKVIYSSLY